MLRVVQQQLRGMMEVENNEILIKKNADPQCSWREKGNFPKFERGAAIQFNEAHEELKSKIPSTTPPFC